jgi:tetratricopeptide (TPR) repeat protein
MRRRRTAVVVAASVIAAAAALFGSVLAGDPPAQSARAPRPEAAAGQILQGFSPGDTAAYVEELVARVERNPADSEGLTLLGLAYQQRARETGDPSFYPRSEAALRKALTVVPKDDLALTGLAALAASRHRFSQSLRLARRARLLNSYSAAAAGIEGDALVELGRYREGFAAFDRMAAMKPSLAAYARVSYARELLGRPQAAIAAMQRAAEAGSANAENAAWTRVQLGNLYFDTGRLGRAGRAYEAARARLPGYVHAQAGLARIHAARGDYRRAAALYRHVVDTLPLPQYAVALGDVLQVWGRREEARQAYGLVDVIQRLFRANGVRTETETALFDIDHERNVAAALARARKAAALWPSIYTQDVLAWALYKNGRCREAQRYSRLALRLGTRDALKIFHRGMIELCLGNGKRGRRFLARALAINPHFSLLYVPVAREALT